MLEIEVDKKTIGVILDKLADIGDLSKVDMKPVLDDVSAFILNRIRTRFLAEQGPDGPWTPSKAALKRRAHGGTGTLFDTGHLFRSLQYSIVDEVTSSINAGGVEYAPYMHYGFTHYLSGAKVGPWPFMGINKHTDWPIIEKIVTMRLQQALDELDNTNE